MGDFAYRSINLAERKFYAVGQAPSFCYEFSELRILRTISITVG